jgi:hypothetical protein
MSNWWEEAPLATAVEEEPLLPAGDPIWWKTAPVADDEQVATAQFDGMSQKGYEHLLKTGLDDGWKGWNPTYEKRGLSINLPEVADVKFSDEQRSAFQKEFPGLSVDDAQKFYAKIVRYTRLAAAMHGDARVKPKVGENGVDIVKEVVKDQDEYENKTIEGVSISPSDYVPESDRKLFMGVMSAYSNSRPKPDRHLPW